MNPATLVSRRTVTRGVAWATPAVFAASAAPSFAVSGVRVTSRVSAAHICLEDDARAAMRVFVTLASDTNIIPAGTVLRWEITNPAATQWTTPSIFFMNESEMAVNVTPEGSHLGGTTLVDGSVTYWLSLTVTNDFAPSSTSEFIFDWADEVGQLPDNSALTISATVSGSPVIADSGSVTLTPDQDTVTTNAASGMQGADPVAFAIVCNGSTGRM